MKKIYGFRLIELITMSFLLVSSPGVDVYCGEVVEFYDEIVPEHNCCEIIEHKGNIAKYKFMKNEITAADIISDISKIKNIKDVSIEEAGIDDIIKIAYGNCE